MQYLLIGLGVIVLIIVLNKLSNGGKRSEAKAFEKLLGEINQQHQTRFTLDPNLRMTEMPSGVVAVVANWFFDRDARKVLIVSKGGKSIEVLNFSYFTGCELIFDERPSD